jgi:endonuclease YncB( thermonuclease family)
MRFYSVTALVSAAVFAGVFFAPKPERAAPVAATFEAAPVGETDPDAFTCTVTGVHDGDGPIYCAEGPKVRLHAIAAREVDDGGCRPGHPCPEASAQSVRNALRRLTMGQTLSCVATGESYDRITAICARPDGTELNCAMVERGYAARWDRYHAETPICG